MIIDTHVHIFPDNIAERASGSIAKFYDLDVRYDGRLSTMFELGEAVGISQFLVHSVATTPTQAGHINDYLAQTVKAYPDQLIGFATIHPDQADMEDEVERAAAMGLKGIKIHPDIQRTDLDDPRFMRLYAAIEGKLPLLAHLGDNRYDYSHPRRMARVIKQYPKLTVICAHLGGWMRWDEAVDELAGKNVYVDTCSSLAWLPPERAAQIIYAFGVERVLFGTDFPMWDPAEELKRMHRLPLAARELDKILGENAQALLAT